ncbi:MAG: DNA recombination protein RmuC [Gammaproteobacteria bacterium]|jgi:DNA recombination protein RmuC
MNIDVPFAISLLVVVAALFAIAIFYRPRNHDEAWIRLQQRLNDFEQAQSNRERDQEQRFMLAQRLHRDDQNKLLQEMDRRLSEIAGAQAHTDAQLRTELLERIDSNKAALSSLFNDANVRMVRTLGELNTNIEQRHTDNTKHLNESLATGLHTLQRQLADALGRNSAELSQRVESLTRTTDDHLRLISAQVEKRLSDGFEKTTRTFGDVLSRLALIDEAQKKITELSNNVVSLQEVLADKRSRGAFGEVQLNALVSNVMPPSAYALQYTLSNDRRADCVLFLPEPSGTIAIDAKFPLESYQRMTDVSASAVERKQAERQFRIDVRTHIKHIAERYIVLGETSDGAIMFLPAEAVFAEIHAHFPDIVQEAHRSRVWLTSPTTLVAILNTARAVLKDEATRRQVHVIQQHLGELASDFNRFRDRMDRLATHIDQANKDVRQVHTSARKITQRFENIEKVEIDSIPTVEDAASSRDD